MRLRKTRKSGPTIEMTPFIDMVFIILIFFLLSTSFIKPVIKMKLPVAESGTKLSSNKLAVISIDQEKNIYLNQKKVSLFDLLSELKTYLNNQNTKTVIFCSDQSVDYGFIVKVMDRIKKAGIESIALEHDKPIL